MTEAATVEPVLAARELTKRFGGVTALDRVSFDVRAGEVHALCGENGAGKSTLIKLLTGVHLHGSYDGEIRVLGAQARFVGTRDAERAGIAVIHQELALIPDLSIAENLFLGALPRRGPYGLVDWDEAAVRARAALAVVGLTLDPRTLIGEVGVGQRQLVEIARALAKQPKVLVLDEPTAALTEHETATLLERVRELRARGVACIYVSHKLEEVFAVSDRITVLRDGQTVVTLEAAAGEEKFSADELIRHMVGRPLGELFPRHASAPGDIVLHVEGLDVSRARGEPAWLRDIALTVRAGEVLGIGGLLGAGRSELLLHLFGAFGHRLRGKVELHGAAFDPREPSAALRAGVALVSEDRRRHGLFLDAAIDFNASLSSLPAVCRGPLIDAAREAERTREWIERLAVKAPSLKAEVSTLSGGNQQKVVLAKAMMTHPKLLLLDEPTRGVDIGAKRELYALIEQWTARGKAVILVSSELPELIAMSDRIAMLCEGRIAGEFARADATQEKLLAAALGGTRQAPRHAPTEAA
jgi:D-xylose transport system ATP-binding protein